MELFDCASLSSTGFRFCEELVALVLRVSKMQYDIVLLIFFTLKLHSRLSDAVASGKVLRLRHDDFARMQQQYVLTNVNLSARCPLCRDVENHD